MDVHENQRKNKIYILATINLCIGVYACQFFASYFYYGYSREMNHVIDFSYNDMEELPMGDLMASHLPHLILYATNTLLCLVLFCGQCAESTAVKKVFLVCGTVNFIVTCLLCVLLAWNWHVHELVYHLGALVMQALLLMLVRSELEAKRPVCNLSYITLTNELSSSKFVIMPDEKIEIMK